MLLPNYAPRSPVNIFENHIAMACFRLDDRGQPVPIPGSELPAGTQLGRWQICADLIGDFRENFACIDYEQRTFFVAQNPQPAGRRALSPVEDFHYRHERSQLGSGYYTYIAPPSYTCI